MRCRVSSDMGRAPLIAYETVLNETLACLATSAMVGEVDFSAKGTSQSKLYDETWFLVDRVTEDGGRTTEDEQLPSSVHRPPSFSTRLLREQLRLRDDL